MKQPATRILIDVGYTHDKKGVVTLQEADTFTYVHPVDRDLTLTADTSTHYCTGWRDMAAKERFVCPESATIADKYEQCATCQRRTGFNPAFYHASSVSKQQERRNQEPHSLYLAYFGDEIIKVGIAHAPRTMVRLLEQGALSAVELETFPTALVARQYEAKIAQLPGIVESVTSKRKLKALGKPYSQLAAERSLNKAIEHIATLHLTFTNLGRHHLTNIYMPNGWQDLAMAHTRSTMVSGHVLGLIGGVVAVENAGNLFALPLRSLRGYKVALDDSVHPLEAPPTQTSLF